MLEEKEIEDFINQYFHTYFTERNFDKLLNFFSPQLNGFGSGLYEKGFNKEQMLNLFYSDIQNISIPINYENVDINIGSISQYIATINCTFDINTELPEGNLHMPNIRNSFTLEKINDKWFILNIHVSIPHFDQIEDESYPRQKLLEKNLLLKNLVEERTTELKEANSKLQNEIRLKDKLLNELKISKKELTDTNDTKDRFFSILAHDLKSPFNSLQGLIEVLLDDYENFDKQTHLKFLKIINENASNINNLVINLLDWSRTQQSGLRFDPISNQLFQLAEENVKLLKPLASKKSIHLENLVEKSLFSNCDTYMISTIMRNLISNAIKFTNTSGGIIKIYSKQNNSQTSSIYIEDNGIGMDAKTIKNLFNLRKTYSQQGTNNETGTGLGLLICKEFLEYHESKLRIESKINQGTKLVFDLKTI